MHLALVGMPGSGKSSTATAVAEIVGMPCADVDDLVADAVGMPIARYFAIEGEERFRAREEAVLGELLAAAEPTVVACGGGVVVTAGARRRLRSSGVCCVWLATSPAELERRLGAAEVATRPLLGEPGSIRRLERDRRVRYLQVADAVVSTDGRTPEQVAQLVVRRVEPMLFRSPAPSSREPAP
jgi:shikimate kinase